MLTGESRPVSKGVGEPAIGGAINGANAVTIEVTATGGKTYLAQVIELVKKAQATRSRTQDLANRAAAWLTYIAQIGRAHVCTPVTNAHLVCRLLLETKTHNRK